MDAQDPWTILAEQGILFRPAPAHTASWEYSIPTLTATWYGPYLTREEALRAALRHLLSQAQRQANTVESTTASTTSPTENLQEYLRSLQQQLFQLHRARALRGIESAHELDPQIDTLLEQIKRIKERMAQSGEA